MYDVPDAIVVEELTVVDENGEVIENDNNDTQS